MSGVWRGLTGGGRLVLVGLLGLIATNIVQFGMLEERAWLYFSALHHRESGNVIEEAWNDDANSSSRLSVFFALSYLAPGSTLMIADEGSTGGGNIIPGRSVFGDIDDYFVERAFAFGEVESVVTVDGDVVDAIAADQVDELMQYAVASASGAFRGPPWTIVVLGGDADVDFPRGYLGRAFDGDEVMTIGPQEFVVVRYADPNIGGEWEFRWVLIDVRLLPDGTFE